jgi:hypothetical protein
VRALCVVQLVFTVQKAAPQLAIANEVGRSAARALAMRVVLAFMLFSF